MIVKYAKKRGWFQWVSAWHEHALEVGHDGVEGFGILRRLARERGPNFARPYPGEDRIAVGVLQVVRNPVDKLVAVAPKAVVVH